MKQFSYILLCLLVIVFCSKNEQGSLITGHIYYEDGIPTDSVYVGLYPLGAERYLGGYEEIQTMLSDQFTLNVNSGLYTLVLYSYEFEKFRQDIFIPDNKTHIDLTIELPRLSIPNIINEVIFHGGEGRGMGWRVKRAMEKEGEVWILKDPSVINKGEKYQIWVNGDVLWDLREKDYTVIHGWTTINNLYSGGKIIFDPSLYKKPKRKATADIKGATMEFNLQALASDLNAIEKEVRNSNHTTQNFSEEQFDSLLQAFNSQFDELEEKYTKPIDQYIFERRISLLSNLHPTYREMRNISREAKGDTSKINAFYQSEKFKNFISDKMAILKQLDPESYLLKGWFANDFLFLDNLIEKSQSVRDELHIQKGYFSDYLLNFAEKCKSKTCTENILYLLSSNYARSEKDDDKKNAEILLNRLKNEYPQNIYVKMGYVDNLLQLIKVTTGTSAPDFEVTTLEGKILKLSDFKGKFVFIDFWGTWCAPCRRELPNIKKLAQSISKDKLKIIGLAQDDEQKLKEYLKNNPLPYENAIAPEKVLIAYGIAKYPTTVLIDPKSRILAKNLGGNQLIEDVRAKIENYR